MEYIYAALLLHNAGKEINEDTITAIVKAAGIEVEPVRVKALVASLEGVNIQEAIEKAAFASAPAAAPTAAPASTAEAAKEAEAKKEEEEEAAEESGMEGLGALFG